MTVRTLLVSELHLWIKLGILIVVKYNKERLTYKTTVWNDKRWSL